MVTLERMRLFKGATELSFSKARVKLSNDHIINEGEAEFEAESTVQTSSVIDFKESTATTNIFSGKVVDLKKIQMWIVKLFTNGYELSNIWITKVYENKSPEFIVEDIVDNFTENLTYASSSSSGVTINKYVANAYLIDVVKDMMDSLQWTLRIDVNDNVYFDPSGDINNGVTFTHGDDINITEWEEDSDFLMNHIRVTGGFENFAIEETISGTGTAFTITKKPAGVMRAVVSGVEVSSDDYTVDAEQLKITFTGSKTDPTFFYSFDKPIIIEDQNDLSINTYGEIYKEVRAPWLDSFATARQYTRGLLSKHSTPFGKAKGIQPRLNFDMSVNETVVLVDTPRNITQTLDIINMEYIGETGETEFEFGHRDGKFFDWQAEVQDRIKKLERQAQNEDDIIQTRLLKSAISQTVTTVNAFEYASPTNTFTLSHPTLNRLRSSVNGSIYNFEADCSDNNNDGTWYGSDIDGAQFAPADGAISSTATYRASTSFLSYGLFNGSDNYVAMTNTISSVNSVAFVIYPEENTRDIIKLSAAAKISINASDEIITTGLSNVTIYVDGVAGIDVVQDTFNYVVVTFDDLSADDIEIGRSSTYFDGRIDTVMIFDYAIIAADITKLATGNAFYDSTNAYTFSGADPKMHLSFDNPKLGLRYTDREAVP
jgi:hypothetical protein